MPPEADNQSTETPVQGDAGANQPDPIQNLKSEFQRKYTNLEETNRQLMAQMQQLMTRQQAPAPKSEPNAKKLQDVWFDNPEEAARMVADGVETKMRRELAQVQQAQAKQQATIGALMKDFPELADNGSKLTTRAVEIYNAMSDEDKSSPVAYRAAVKEAAMELDLKPKSKRTPASDDSFSLGGDGAGASRPKPSGKKEVDQRTKLFAEAVGLNLDDPKNKKSLERIQGRHGRKSYESWG